MPRCTRFATLSIGLLVLVGCSNGESDAWTKIIGSRSPEAYQAFLDRYPQSPHAEEAQEWLIFLKTEDKEDNWKMLENQFKTSSVRMAVATKRSEYAEKSKKQFVEGMMVALVAWRTGECKKPEVPPPPPVVIGSEIIKQEASPLAVFGSISTAAEYKPGPGPHKLAVIDGHSGGTPKLHEWHQQLPEPWRATALGNLELIVFVDQKNRKLQDIPYVDKKTGVVVRTIPSIQQIFHIDVLAARNCKQVYTTVLDGPLPVIFEEVSAMRQTELNGGPIPWDTVKAWLEPFVDPKK